MSNYELSSSQEFLWNNDLIKHRSSQRARALACLACRWAKSEENDIPPQAYGYEIIKCSGIKSGALYPILKHLETVGVIESEVEDIDEVEAERPKRKYLIPVQTELGRAFRGSMETPTQCSLEQTPNA